MIVSFSFKSFSEPNRTICGKLIPRYYECNSIQLYGKSFFTERRSFQLLFDTCSNSEKFSYARNYLVFSAPPKLQVDVEGKLSIEKSLKKVSANVDSSRPVKDEVNILLLGQTGIGKSTLINALANYLVNNTLEQAVNDRMQVPIPFSFPYIDVEAFENGKALEDREIFYGEDDGYEQIMKCGETCTQKCRSFAFRIGDRLLRFIDTPPLGDTRGFEQDIQNMDEIMNYIARYKYLHGISILLTSHCSLSIFLLEFLKHLPKNALENIIYIFTISRSTFFCPSSAHQLLKKLFDRCNHNYDIQIPFQKANTFLVDNESFRYLALHHHGIRCSTAEGQDRSKSWNYTVKELMRFLSYIIDLPACAVRDIVSLYQVQRFISLLAHFIFQIDQHIVDALDEQEKIEDVYKKLCKYLQIHCTIPFNERHSANQTELIDAENIFPLIATLYDLPIHGERIRMQAEELKHKPSKIEEREIFVQLPAKADSSSLMLEFKRCMSKIK